MSPSRFTGVQTKITICQSYLNVLGITKICNSKLYLDFINFKLNSLFYKIFTLHVKMKVWIYKEVWLTIFK